LTITQVEINEINEINGLRGGKFGGSSDYEPYIRARLGTAGEAMALDASDSLAREVVEI